MPKNIGWLCFCIAVIGHSAVAVSQTTTSPDAQTLKTLDDDKSSSVDANEIASFVESLMGGEWGASLESKEGRLALAQAILAEYDTDGSGMIDTAEMAASTTAGGEKPPLATFVFDEIQRMDRVAKTGWAMFVVTAIILMVTFVGLQKYRVHSAKAHETIDEKVEELDKLYDMSGRVETQNRQLQQSLREAQMLSSMHAKGKKEAQRDEQALRSTLKKVLADIKRAVARGDVRDVREALDHHRHPPPPPLGRQQTLSRKLYDMKNFNVEKTLGAGSFGKVMLCTSTADGKTYAIKQIDMSNNSVPEQMIDTMWEAEIMSQLHHPHMVQYFSSFTDGLNFFIVMEYADGGDLAHKLEQQTRRGATVLLGESEVLNMFGQLALAIKYLHDRDILHRDLKPRNIFLTSEGDIKLGDLGISMRLSSSDTVSDAGAGTPLYMAPEVWDAQRPYNHKADVWGCGCILHEMCTLEVPFPCTSSVDQLKRDISSSPSPLISSNYSVDLSALVTSMLSKDPSQRPSIDGVLNTPIVRNALELQGIDIPAAKTSSPADSRVNPLEVEVRWSRE